MQLTWQSHIAFVYDRFSFRQLRTFHYDCDGWGLTGDDKNLILSDGTAELRFFDPATFREVRHIYATAESTALFLKWMSLHQLGRKRLLDTQLAADLWTA